MKDLYILGAGGHAKEVYFLAERIGKWNIKGMLDIRAADPIIIAGKEIPVYSESSLDELNGENVCLVIGIAGSVKVLKKMVTRYRGKFEFPNLIDPSLVSCQENIVVGVGNVISPNNTITTSLKIGSYNVFNIGGVVHHDVVIGNYNIFCPSVNVSGGVEIGDSNYFGVKSTILQNIKIGNKNIIGGASLVINDIEDNSKVMGIPAKLYIKK
jgi:sugar O-acyltransferase (sialic acid O-acetyltransferase NeuD family)